MTAVIAWLAANIWTVLICAALVAIVVLIVFSMVRNKKKGRSSCGCGGCSGCAMNGKCHSDNKDK